MKNKKIASEKKAIINNIFHLMKVKGWTGKILSEKSGINASQLSRYKDPDSDITLTNLLKIAHGMDVPLSELVDYKKKKVNLSAELEKITLKLESIEKSMSQNKD